MPRQAVNQESKTIKICSFAGDTDEIPVEKWFRLYDKLAVAAHWTGNDKIEHLHEHLEGEAMKWYLQEVFEVLTSWHDIEASFTQRFGVTVADPFRAFIHYRLQKNQSVKEYFDNKRKLGHQSKLACEHIISGLTDGLPTNMETNFVGLTINNTAEWLTIAQRVESCLKRSDRSKVSNISSPISPSTSRPPLAPQKRTLQPTTPCRFCEARGKPNQLHWHSMCPNNSALVKTVTNTDEDSENGDSDLREN